MQVLANRLMAQARGLTVPSDSRTPDSALAAASGRVRYALWPFISADHPEIAMGLMTALAFQLERWPDALVYRLVVRADEAAFDLPESSLSSQFSVDDWQLDYLDENVAIWGELVRTGSGWRLGISIENDLTGDDVHTLTFDAGTLTDLIQRIPDGAAQITALTGAGYASVLAPSYVGGSDQRDDSLATFLTQAFRWEKALFLSLWRGDTERSWGEMLDELLMAAGQVDSDFAGWLVASSLRRSLRPATEETIRQALPELWAAATSTLDLTLIQVAAAQALIANDEETQGLSQLETLLSNTPEDTRVRLAYADGLRAAGRTREMIEVLQDGLDLESPSAELYFYYGTMIVALHRSNIVVNNFVLIDASDRQLVRMIEEASAAYALGLELVPDRLDMLQRRLLLLIELQDEALWTEFEQLVEQDSSGEYIHIIVDSFLLLEDVEPGLDILERAIEREPERVDLRVSYAIALLAGDFNEDATEQLEVAEDLTEDQAVIAEIERLFLQAEDPEFEGRFGELTELVAAGRALTSRDVAFLEDALERAPTFAAGYLLLARSWINQDLRAEALEVLLDGQNVLPEDATISAELAQNLWALGEHDLAFDYLNKGLAHNPDDVALLALSGRYLFDEGQDEEARTFLSRAQSLDPRNRTLVEAQRYVASRYQ